MKDITPIQDVPPLRALREARGLTREDLASQARVSKETIERLERASTARPHRLTRISIAEALGVDEDDLWPQEAAAA